MKPSMEQAADARVIIFFVMAYQRIVAKFGTSLLTAGTGRLDLQVMSSLVAQVAALRKQGKDITIVTSGAVAAGRQKLGPDALRTMANGDIPSKQVLASVGQGRLMNAYEQLFDWHDITVAQALLTRSALVDRAGYLNARNTLLGLNSLGVVCIVNENDVVASEELEGVAFGDNDNLSAMVSNLIDADLLVLLTNIGGLYTADPHSDPSAKLLTRVESIDENIEKLAGGTADKQGTGGMVTKLQAAKLATASGAAVVVADGYLPNSLVRIASGESLGTLFVPRVDRMESRKRWLACGLNARGSLTVDDGAAGALKKDKSLLPAGVLGVEGDFNRGDVVYVVDSRGNRIACGVSNYDSGDIAKLKGVKSDRISGILGYEFGAEVVHCNNLAML